MQGRMQTLLTRAVRHAPALSVRHPVCAHRASLGQQQRAHVSTAAAADDTQQWEVRALPAPGVPFHVAIPVHNLDEAKAFYGGILGCEEGRSSTKWQDYSLHGHQVVCHWVGEQYKPVDYFNPVDGDEVPVPHYGLQCPSYELWRMIVDRVKAAGVPFIIEPTLRFEGMPGEQWTCFFKDPSGNNLEFKHMAKPELLFAKYNVAEG